MADLLKVEGQGFEELKKTLLTIQRDKIPTVMDHVVASVVAAGRRKVDADNAVNLGGNTEKYTSEGLHKGGSVWDSKLGGYRARANGMRLINFSFEQSRRKTPGRKFSKVYVTSQVQNLWARPTKAYASDSPFFRRADAKRFGVWKKGKSRQSKVSWSRFVAGIASGLPEGISRAQAWLDEEIKKGAIAK